MKFLAQLRLLRQASLFENVWKEMNNRIFKNEKRPYQSLFEPLLKQLKETVGTVVRNHPKNPTSDAGAYSSGPRQEG